MRNSDSLALYLPIIASIWGFVLTIALMPHFNIKTALSGIKLFSVWNWKAGSAHPITPPYTSSVWQRWQSRLGNATLPWQTLRHRPAKMSSML
jgi:hypothetical protein